MMRFLLAFLLLLPASALAQNYTYSIAPAVTGNANLKTAAGTSFR